MCPREDASSLCAGKKNYIINSAGIFVCNACVLCCVCVMWCGVCAVLCHAVWCVVGCCVRVFDACGDNWVTTDCIAQPGFFTNLNLASLVCYSWKDHRYESKNSNDKERPRANHKRVMALDGLEIDDTYCDDDLTL